MEERLQKYCKRVQNSTDAAQVVKEALGDPKILLFNELLDLSQVQALAQSEQSGLFNLLVVFAYGTLSTYQRNEAALPQLAEAELKKLKRLTLLSIASKDNGLPYAPVQKTLQLQSLEEMEQFVIEFTYDSQFRCHLDQAEKVIEIEHVEVRDVINPQILKLCKLQGLEGPLTVEQMIDNLAVWRTKSERLLTSIAHNVDTIVKAEAVAQRKEELEAQRQEKQAAMKHGEGSSRRRSGVH